MPIKSEIGLASYYSRRFDGKTTASGQTFSNDEFVAAHASLPLGTLVRITNLDTDVSAELQIIDRGPSKQNRREGVIIDVSQAAARKLQMKKVGRVKVRLEVLKLGDDMHQPLQKVTEKQKARK
jgi:rare lipoprotein A